MIVKVCGMREADNIREVERLGVQWMGFIFHPASPRYVEAPPAYLPRRARRVGVFVNAPADEVVRRVRAFGLHAVQLHGGESPAYCAELLHRLCEEGHEVLIVKTFSLSCGEDVGQTEAYESCCHAFLFDTPCADYGGSGRTFDWNLLRRYRGRLPFLLSGGISPGHAAALRAFSHPQWAGIDLNSCFESRPGRKDIRLLEPFLREIHSSNP